LSFSPFFISGFNNSVCNRYLRVKLRLRQSDCGVAVICYNLRMHSQRIVNYRFGGNEWVPRFISALNQNRCNQCCTCVQICPAQVFKRTVKGIVEPINRDNCIGCTVCERQCPVAAITCLPLSADNKPQ